MSESKSLGFREALESLGTDWQEIADSVRNLPVDKAISCSKGCGTCCHYGLIASSSLEAFGVLVSWIGRGRALEQLASQCEHYTERYKDAVQAIGHLPFSKTSRQAFLAHKLACPLLGKTGEAKSGVDRLPGSCTIYDDRPVICSAFNSTAAPKLCLSLEGHASDTSRIDSGQAAAESLRSIERSIFGKSALGHLPLLIAALTTEQGLQSFLRVDPLADNPEEQGIKDFFFYAELLEGLDIHLTEADYADLELAQTEDGAGHSSPA